MSRGPRHPNRLHVYLGTEARRRLEKRAAELGVPMTSVVAQVVGDWLDGALIAKPAPEPEADWRPLVRPRGSRRRPRPGATLTAERLIATVGAVKAAALVRDHGERELPSALSVGRILRRDAIRAEWRVHRWHHPRFLRQLAGRYGVTLDTVRRWLGHSYWTKRRDSYWKRRGVLSEAAREAQAEAGVQQGPRSALSIRRVL